MNSTGIKNVILYTRVSTDEQAQQGHSLRHQRDVLQRYSDLKGYNVLKMFEDDYSAKSFDRPDWKKMMEYIKANKKIVDAILFTKWDRYSRNLEESYRVMRELTGMGVEVNSIEQPLDLSIPENKLLLAIYLAIPEVENDKNSSRTKDGMRRAKKDGFWVGSAPFGYSNTRTPNNKPTLKLNERASLVNKAFSLIATGIHPMEEVRRQMSKSGMRFSKQGFINIITNVAYNGRIYIPEYGKDQAEIVKGVHPAIIDDELWETVQNVVSNKRRKQFVTGKQNAQYPLRGHLICPKCGKNLTGGASKGRYKKYPYYNCEPSCGFRHPIEDAHNKFLRFLETFMIRDEVVSVYIKIMKDVYKKNEGDKAEQYKLVEKQIRELEDIKSNAFDKYMRDEISKEVWSENNLRMEMKIGDLRARKTEQGRVNSKGIPYMEFGIGLVRNLPEIYNQLPIEIKHKLLGSLFPSKLIFDKVSYRTSNDNHALSLLYKRFNGLRRDINKKVDKNADQSTMAPPA